MVKNKMNDFENSGEQTLGKVTIISIMIVAKILPLLFFVAMELWELAGLPRATRSDSKVRVLSVFTLDDGKL
jgi:hypothetical protein